MVRSKIKRTEIIGDERWYYDKYGNVVRVDKRKPGSKSNYEEWYISWCKDGYGVDTGIDATFGW